MAWTSAATRSHAHGHRLCAVDQALQAADCRIRAVSNDLGDEIDYLPALEAKHVDGTMNVVERNQKLSWLKGNIGKDEPVCRILTNARCSPKAWTCLRSMLPSS
jgi:hypothetical protein